MVVMVQNGIVQALFCVVGCLIQQVIVKPTSIHSHNGLVEGVCSYGLVVWSGWEALAEALP